MIKTLVEHNDKYTNSEKRLCSGNEDTKLKSKCAITAVIGLLYLAGLMCSGSSNMNEACAREELGVELFHMIMSILKKLFSLFF
jgi:hypothetical protein